MPSIAYFISDHGLGHATRSVAIIRSLLECDPEISFNVHTSIPLSLVQRSFSSSEHKKRVDFQEQPNDIGFISDKITGKIDFQNTAQQVSS